MKKLLLVLMPVLIGAGLVFADQAVITTYAPMHKAPGQAISSPVSSPASIVLDTPVNPRATAGDAFVVVAPSSSIQGAQICLEVILYQRDDVTLQSSTYGTIAATTTITCNSLDTIGGRYVPTTSPYILAPTLGLQVYDVRLRSISSGNASWISWHCGKATAPSSSSNE